MSLLVADYGSSSEGEDDEPSPELKAAASKTSSMALVQNGLNTPAVDVGSLPSGGEISDEDLTPSGHISDEEEDGPSMGSAAWDEDDLIGGSSASLRLPPPKSSVGADAAQDAPISLNDEDVTRLNLSSLPKPSIETESLAGSGDTDELEEFVRPRDWEKEEALKAKKTKFGADVAAASDRFGAVPSKKASNGGRVKISIPRLTSNDDDDEDDKKPKDAGLPQTKNLKPAGSGLFALLPQPKNVSSTKMEKRPLIPHVLTKKPTTTKPTSSSTLKRPAPPTDEGKNSESNFFSLDGDDDSPSISSEALKRVRVAPSPNVSDFDKLRSRVSHPDPEDSPLSFSSKKRTSTTISGAATSGSGSSSASISSAPSAAQMYNMAGSSSSSYNPEEVDDSRSNLASLMGAQRVRGGDLDQMNIVDVSADSALGGTSSIQENLLRELSAASESGYRPRPKKGEEPSGLSKRKHQITYLAFQAKEREQMLKNQWAQNAQTKRQTQAKYGF